jgi:hypothetical protein
MFCFGSSLVSWCSTMHVLCNSSKLQTLKLPRWLWMVRCVSNDEACIAVISISMTQCRSSLVHQGNRLIVYAWSIQAELSISLISIGNIIWVFCDLLDQIQAVFLHWMLILICWMTLNGKYAHHHPMHSSHHYCTKMCNRNHRSLLMAELWLCLTKCSASYNVLRNWYVLNQWHCIQRRVMLQNLAFNKTCSNKSKSKCRKIHCAYRF